jgi:hypothetical protein
MTKLIALFLFTAACGTAPQADGTYQPSATTYSIQDPDIAADGYVIYRPEQKQGLDPTEPTFVELAIGEEGVALAGPLVENPPSDEAAQLFALDRPSMSWEVTSSTYEGLTVQVNPRLAYRFDIGDYEDELHVARVDLDRTDAGLQAHFILLADGCDGVAFASQITALVDGQVVAGPTEAWTIRADGHATGVCPWRQ